MFTIVFWIASLERAIKTAAQAVVLGLGLGEGLNAFEIDWRLAAGFALGGFVLSLLTSIISAPFSAKGSPDISGTQIPVDVHRWDLIEALATPAIEMPAGEDETETSGL
jgi:Putative lactococcus lactis phage r1t holin